MSEWPSETISSWKDLEEKLNPIAERCVFRGQGNQDWPLISSFARALPNISSEEWALQIELRAILNFRSQAHLHLSQSVLPPDSFKLDKMDTYLEWLMLMQHYGAPTRLLDWTNSPYVALYFAVINEWNSDAAIWYFDNWRVNERMYSHHNIQAGEIFDYVNLPVGVLRATEGEPILYTAAKKMRTAREIAQQGVFTVTNRVLTPHDEAIANSCEGYLFGRLIIPASLKEDFVHRLVLMNVTAAALFPGVEGICESIRENLKLANERVKQHAWLPS